MRTKYLPFNLTFCITTLRRRDRKFLAILFLTVYLKDIIRGAFKRKKKKKRYISWGILPGAEQNREQQKITCFLDNIMMHTSFITEDDEDSKCWVFKDHL